MKRANRNWVMSLAIAGLLALAGCGGGKVTSPAPAPVCGSGTTQSGETCDDGANNGQPNYCNDTCTGMVPATCGNGTIESGETCDDGNTAGGDGCSAVCTTETLATNAWITIPAGDFVMGCAAADGNCNADGREEPKHTVTLSEYKIQKYEVTNAQYAACVAASACSAPPSSNSNTRTPYYGNAVYDYYPVIYVDWNMATTYCAWIGGRLPTEAEWEKAARGPYPAEPIYSWGDGAPNCTLANQYDGAAYCGGDTSQAGSYPAGASTYGVMDLAGNVWEWVHDWRDANYYRTGGPPWNDPQGPGSGDYRVLRGGSWNYDAVGPRVSFRGGELPDNSFNSVGFRCAQD